MGRIQSSDLFSVVCTIRRTLDTFVGTERGADDHLEHLVPWFSSQPEDTTRNLEVLIPPTPSPNSPQSLQEVSVKTTSNWKKAPSLGGRMKSPKSPHSGELKGWWEDPADPVHISNKCALVMLDLWRDPNLKQRLRSEESSGLSVPLIIVYLTSARRP